MFSGVSLSDRLKAAVNQLEATGSSLQQRALTAAQQAQTPPLDRRSSNSTVNTVKTDRADDRPQSPRSPPPTGSASHLADSALSGLNELRRSFSNFRNSQEGARPSSADLEAAGRAQNRSSSPLKKAEAETSGTSQDPKKESKEASELDNIATTADAKESKDKSELLAPEFDFGTPNTSAAVSGQATPAPPEASEAPETSLPKAPAPENGDESTPAAEPAANAAGAETDVGSEAPVTTVETGSQDAAAIVEPTPVTETPSTGGSKKKKKKGKKGVNANAEKPEDSKPKEELKSTAEASVEPPVKGDASTSDKPTEADQVKKDDSGREPTTKAEDEAPAPIRLPTPTEDDPVKTLEDTERRFEGEPANAASN